MTDRNARFQNALDRLDALHAEDPRREQVADKEIAYELLYAQRMSEWLGRVAPQASEALRLATRAQHLQRWLIPRDNYPKDRRGYLAWRRALGHRQAEQAAQILHEAGYDEAVCQQVAGMIRKERLRSDPDTQALEDTACLVFLAHYFADFTTAHEETKLLRIVRKTWNKMSPRGHELAMTIPLPDDAQALLRKALA
ncbi:DUF4202 domain-containing protein [Nitrococcus mobilis]|uniref:Glutamyl-tRNA synthetase n=1 Tax=Nitrococcus mobilis Nb-231 TaxID=314278 RepID=A4BUI2_9GAMM|nr:DUF4202 domain-containing protein [Nitrococcus mobilis]EAR20696.1 hypothetical protein NB231_02228 [Nitrococcus mobilis Nb-231]